MISRNGICYDLSISDYKHKIGNLTFVFSSQLHLEKFIDKLQENREEINKSLSNRFKLSVEVETLSDIVLYKKIETRGFLILTDKEIEVCQENLTFGGGKVILKNLNAQ